MRKTGRRWNEPISWMSSSSLDRSIIWIWIFCYFRAIQFQPQARLLLPFWSRASSRCSFALLLPRLFLVSWLYRYRTETLLIILLPPLDSSLSLPMTLASHRYLRGRSLVHPHPTVVGVLVREGKGARKTVGGDHRCSACSSSVAPDVPFRASVPPWRSRLSRPSRRSSSCNSSPVSHSSHPLNLPNFLPFLCLSRRCRYIESIIGCAAVAGAARTPIGRPSICLVPLLFLLCAPHCTVRTTQVWRIASRIECCTVCGRGRVCNQLVYPECFPFNSELFEFDTGALERTHRSAKWKLGWINTGLGPCEQGCAEFEFWKIRNRSQNWNFWWPRNRFFHRSEIRILAWKIGKSLQLSNFDES